VWYKTPWPRARRRPPEHVDYVSRDGKVQESYTLPLRIVRGRWSASTYTLGGNVIAPLLGVGACVGSLPREWRMCGAVFRPPFEPYVPGDPPSALPFAVAVCLLCAWLAIRLARQYAFSRLSTWAWALFVLLTGLPGLLAFLGANEWPLRQRCHSCGKKRVVTREHCEHCGVPFPLPARDGTEVLEPA